MIAAADGYQLPSSIDRKGCLAHHEKIAPGSRGVKGLISKHFIYGDHRIAGGVYQRETRKDAEAFFSGPWLAGTNERYGNEPETEFFTVICITDYQANDVRALEQNYL